MFRFANPEYLWLLLLLPALLILFLYGRRARKRELAAFGEAHLLEALMPEVSNARSFVKFFLLFAAIAVSIFVIAAPQFGSKLESVKRKGVEVMIALDVSNSMMARDITPSRLEKSKQIVGRLSDRLRDDKIGLIVFAGDAFTQLPMTSDNVSAKMFFSSINPGIVPVQGTAVGAAIRLATRSFTPNEASGKSIVVITDGENHEDNAVEAAQAAQERGISVNVIGIGSPQGAPIPEGQSSSSFRRDAQGNVVVTKLNEEMCREIAQAGKGVYVHADNAGSALRAITSEIDKMNKSEIESQVYSEYDEQYGVVAWIVLLLLIIEFALLEKKNPLFRNIHLFR
ncbi:MAG: VWA domain-containing protein [Bacteroidales bacterium]